MDKLEPMSDVGPAPRSASAASADARPWRLRRPVLAGLVLYGALALVLSTIGWFWIDQREKGRQDALLTTVHGVSGYFTLDTVRAIRVLENEVLAQSPSDDTRRRALLVLAAAYDAGKRYDEADRTYATARAEWPAGLESGPLVVPWANMLVNAGRARQAKELLAPAGAANGYGTREEVDLVRSRVERALEADADPK